MLFRSVGPETRSSVETLDAQHQRKLAVLERLLAVNYCGNASYRNPSATGVAFLDDAFRELREFVSLTLTSQIELPLLLGGIQQVIDPASGSTRLEARNAVRWLTSCFKPQRDLLRLREVARSIKLLPDRGWAIEEAMRQAMQGTPEQRLMARLMFTDTLRVATMASHAITDTSGDDIILGSDTADMLITGIGCDVHIGGKGDDLIQSGGGDDQFVFARGDGHDRISDYDLSASNVDEVYFIDLSREQLSRVWRNGHDLHLSLNSGDSLTVQSYFISTANRIEQFRFADGQLWGHDQLVERLWLAGATQGNDQLGGFNDTPNRIDGLGGDDLLVGGELNDLLRGGDGNDRLWAGAGDDLLEGGSGDDALRGDRKSTRLNSSHSSVSRMPSSA